MMNISDMIGREFQNKLHKSFESEKIKDYHGEISLIKFWINHDYIRYYEYPERFINRGEWSLNIS